MKLPEQRWVTHISDPTTIDNLVSNGVPATIAPVLLNRGIGTKDYHDAWNFLDPENMKLPNPVDEFPGLADAIAHLLEAPGPIGICGDYDTDGMTSTALLLRTFEHLGMKASYQIPSRLQEGYGLNDRIVKDFFEEGIRTIVTVDNGISAHQPIKRAKQMGMTVIVTDHHEIPKVLPDAIIVNPKLLSQDSSWRGLAGVGVAYVLGINLAIRLGKTKGLADQLLELFTIGTIVDMVPLTGVNRKLVIKGLKLLGKPKLPGLQALLQVANIKGNVKPDDIGFKLGPYINAVGRIGNPETVLKLFSARTVEDALPFAEICRETNRDRQQITSDIEKMAVEMAEKAAYKQNRVLVLFNPDWHVGVIGIVASRLVERFGVPVFLIAESDDKLKGSARGIEVFNVFESLRWCSDTLLTSGGHKAAGGFSLWPDNFDNFKADIYSFSLHQLKPEHCIPSIKLDGNIRFSEISLELLDKLAKCQPWGIENKEPIFWSNSVQVLNQEVVKGGHRRFYLQQGSHRFNGIAWRWEEYELPNIVDIAYKLKLNEWNGKTTIQLELVGARVPLGVKEFDFTYNNETLKYSCQFDYDSNELHLINSEGISLFFTHGNPDILIGPTRQKAASFNINKRLEFFSKLFQEAYDALGIIPLSPIEGVEWSGVE
jgi:single-stranded-DNA-specific exonuclease